MQESSGAPLLSISEWVDRYSLDDILSEYRTMMDLGDLAINSPFHLVTVEKLRPLVLVDPQAAASSLEDYVHLVFEEELRSHGVRELNGLPSKTADLFVFQEGCPPRRDLTQIGGLPYRPRNLPWPCDFDKTPLTFVAQMRFRESQDIVGSTRGDVLLIFIDAGWPDVVKCEWYPLGLEDLVGPEDVPETSWSFVHCWGHRYRTCDYSDRAARFGANSLAVLKGMKIGGYSRFRCLEDDGFEADWEPKDLLDCRNLPVSEPTSFLGHLHSIFPATGVSYPWIAHPEPLSVDGLTDDNTLNIGDAHGIDFFLTQDGRVAWGVTGV